MAGRGTLCAHTAPRRGLLPSALAPLSPHSALLRSAPLRSACPSPGSRRPAPALPLPSSHQGRCLVFDGGWLMVDGLWSMFYGLWSMVDGRWSMVQGPCCMVDRPMACGPHDLEHARHTPGARCSSTSRTARPPGSDSPSLGFPFLSYPQQKRSLPALRSHRQRSARSAPWPPQLQRPKPTGQRPKATVKLSSTVWQR